MEFKVKGKVSLEDLKLFYRQMGARSVFYRLMWIFLIVALMLTLGMLIAGEIVCRQTKYEAIIILIGLYLIYVFWRKIRLPKAVKKIYDSDKSYGLECEMTFLENQIEAKDERGQALIKKEDIYYVLFSSEAVYIYKSKLKAVTIPKHFFESEEQWKEFLEFVKQNYVPGPKKFRWFKPLKWWMIVLDVALVVGLFVIYALLIFK